MFFVFIFRVGDTCSRFDTFCSKFGLTSEVVDKEVSDDDILEIIISSTREVGGGGNSLGPYTC